MDSFIIIWYLSVTLNVEIQIFFSLKYIFFCLAIMRKKHK